MDTYVSLCCSLPESMEEALPWLVGRWPVLGTQICEAGAGRVTATIFLHPDHEDAVDPLGVALGELGAEDLRVEPVAAEDWLAGYRLGVRPFSVGDGWWIDPHPDRPTAAPQGRLRLAVEPRMAFGSGSHESTRLVLLALEGLEVAGAGVLDIGAGSGILALAAEKLGASLVVALDIDPGTVWVARQIAGQQEEPSRVQFVLGPVACICGPGFDLVLCNMIASHFVPLLGDLRRLIGAGGLAVISGLLVSEREAVTETLAANGLQVRGDATLGEWASLTVARAAHGGSR